MAGLRREKAAQLAAISVDYLTRLEQGRVQASTSVLITLANALRLDGDQRIYLFELAGRAPLLLRRRPAQTVRPAMRRLLDQLTESPAMILGHRMDILAWSARRGGRSIPTSRDTRRIAATTSTFCSTIQPSATSTQTGRDAASKPATFQLC